MEKIMREIERKFDNEFKLSELNEFIKENKDTYEFKDIFSENLNNYAQGNEYGNVDVKLTPLEDSENNEYLFIVIEVFNYDDKPENYTCKIVNIEIQ